MGFTFMEAFMDEVLVESRPGEGTTVRMKKDRKTRRTCREVRMDHTLALGSGAHTREIKWQEIPCLRKMWD